jgi:antitoxin HigA-1
LSCLIEKPNLICGSAVVKLGNIASIWSPSKSIIATGDILMARMFNPPHPGLTLRDDVLPALGLTVTQAAAQLDVSRVAFSRVLNGRAAISPEMALRIEAWLGVARGGEARLWLAEQSAYDVWQAAQRFKLTPMHVQPAPATA